MKTNFFYSLKFRFSLLIIIASLPIMLFTFLDIKYDAIREIDNISARTSQLVKFTAINEERAVEETRLVLNTQVNSVYKYLNNNNGLSTYLSNQLNTFSHYQNFYVINKNGIMIAEASDNFKMPQNVQRYIYEKALINKRFQVFHGGRSSLNSGNIIVITFPVFNSSNDLEFIIAASMNESYLIRPSEEILTEFPSNTLFIRTDLEGNIISSYLNNSETILTELKNSKSFKSLFGDGKPNTDKLELKLKDGLQYILFLSTSKKKTFLDNHYFIVGIEESQYLSTFHKSLLQNLTIYLIVFMFVLIISWYLINKYILNHVNKLIKSTQAVALNNYDIQSGVDYRIGELGKLAASFDNLVMKLNENKKARLKVEESLRIKENRFRKILESIRLVSIMLDDNANITFVNDYLLKLTGWEKHEVLNKNWYDLFLPPEIRDESKTNFINTLRNGDYKPYIENYILTRDGEKRLIAWNNTIIKDLEGNTIGTTSIGEDITERKLTETQLRITEERFNIIINNLPMTFYVIDNSGIVTFHDGNGLEELGMSKGENVGKSAFELFGSFPFNDFDNNTILGKDIITRVLKGETIQAISKLNDVWFDNYFAPSFDERKKITGLVGVSLNITERVKVEVEKNKLNSQIAESKQSLENLTKRLFKVQENEKRNLARELHDEIGQLLSVIKINIQNSEDSKETQYDESHLNEVVGLIDEGISKIRNISLALRPSILDDLGLIPSLRWFVKNLNKKDVISISFESNVENISVDPEMEITIYRITQEAITNTLRHSDAKNINIYLNIVDENIDLKINDDGQGFNVSEGYENAARGKSIGLLSMKERTELLNGVFSIDSTNNGTKILATFPKNSINNSGKI